MFSKAKRFENIGPIKNQAKILKKPEDEKPSNRNVVATKLKTIKSNAETRSLCSSVPSSKSFATPIPLKKSSVVKSNSFRQVPISCNGTKKEKTDVLHEDIMKAHEVEIRNKDYTIAEYNKQVEELKTEIAMLHRLSNENSNNKDFDSLNIKFGEINLEDHCVQSGSAMNSKKDLQILIEMLQFKIQELEKQCDKLEEEVSSKQVELTSLETIITIRDSLCEDLQKKLNDMESSLDETRQRLEMVKGHHALALEANESIRREYKAELETIKTKFEEEKLNILNKYKIEQESVRVKYNNSIESIKRQMIKEKDEKINDLQQELVVKDQEMQAKLEQIDEATHEKLRLCEIQFEERSRSIQDHCTQQHQKIQMLEAEIQDLKYTLNKNEDQKIMIEREANNLHEENDSIKQEKLHLVEELNELKEDMKKKLIDFENEKNKLTVEVDKAVKDKQKFEMSLLVTRDIVQVLSLRLRESDNELEHLENKVQSLTNSKELLDDELTTYKTTLNNTVMECTEYKEALVNILKSKAALAKEHTRIMEHNVSLIESLQNVEKEAYRELGTIKNELIEDVELIKKESKSQIQILRDEVEKKRVLCELAKEHAGQANAAAEQSRMLLAQAAAEISRLESDNRCLQNQIQDQQSLVVELSLLRQENEELSMTAAKQSSIIDKMKKDIEQTPKSIPKSPSLTRKAQKIGKENVQNVIVSPLRERNH